MSWVAEGSCSSGRQAEGRAALRAVAKVMLLHCQNLQTAPMVEACINTAIPFICKLNASAKGQELHHASVGVTHAAPQLYQPNPRENKPSHTSISPHSRVEPAWMLAMLVHPHQPVILSHQPPSCVLLLPLPSARVVLPALNPSCHFSLP